MITQHLSQLIGNTPLFELKNLSLPKGIRAFAKLEMFNPTGSIKDRIVLHMINQAEKAGLISAGSTLIEATSGNTGASLAAIGRLKGYRVIITTPAKTSDEKIAIMRAYGAEVYVCKADEETDYMVAAKNFLNETPNSYMLNQYYNLENREAHYLTTGKEIWDQMNGLSVDYFVTCASSGGTISGVSRYLKEKANDVKVVLADPKGSVYHDYFHEKKIIAANQHSYQVEGAGKDLICDCMDFSLIDNVVQFDDDQAFNASKKLAKMEGLLVGGSSGGALHAVEAIAKTIDSPANIVTILPDSGMKYLSKMF